MHSTISCLILFCETHVHFHIAPFLQQFHRSIFGKAHALLNQLIHTLSKEYPPQSKPAGEGIAWADIVAIQLGRELQKPGSVCLWLPGESVWGNLRFIFIWNKKYSFLNIWTLPCLNLICVGLKYIWYFSLYYLTNHRIISQFTSKMKKLGSCAFYQRKTWKRGTDMNKS